MSPLKFWADIMDLSGIMRSIFKWDYQDSPKNRIESYCETIKFCNGSYYCINIAIIIWKYAHFYQNGNDLFLVQGNITVTIIKSLDLIPQSLTLVWTIFILGGYKMTGYHLSLTDSIERNHDSSIWNIISEKRRNYFVHSQMKKEEK